MDKFFLSLFNFICNSTAEIENLELNISYSERFIISSHSIVGDIIFDLGTHFSNEFDDVNKYISIYK